jgi:hypothetical protein
VCFCGSGKPEKEYEMIVKRTLQSICVLTINPNTTTSVIVQVNWFGFCGQILFIFLDLVALVVP